MQTTDAIAALSALAHPTRLRCYAVLAERGSCTAGELAEALAIPKNSLSGHAAILSQAGLIGSVRAGRTVTYSPEPRRLSDLLRHLEGLSSSPSGEPLPDPLS